MADPVTATMMVISSGASLLEGVSKSAAMKTDAKQLEYQASGYKLRASQISHSRREQLNEALGTIDSVLASRNVSGTAFGSDVTRRTAIKRSITNENAEVLGAKMKEQQLINQAKQKRRAAIFPIIQGGLSALTTLGSPEALKAMGAG